MGTFRFALILSLLSGCSLLFDQAEQLEGPDGGGAIVLRDFTDVIAAQPASEQQSIALLGGFTGKQAVFIVGEGTLSTDNIHWSDTLELSADTPLFIRSQAPAQANQTSSVLVEIGELQLPWAISTHPARTSFDSAGSFLWSNPGIRGVLHAQCWGGGGGAGAGGGEGFVGGGGGGGGYSQLELLSEELQAVEVIVVGAGGSGARLSGQSGDVGEKSLVGAHLVAEGGTGGQPASLGGEGGAGGSGSTEAGMNGYPNEGGDAGGQEHGGGMGASDALDGFAPGGGGGGSHGAGGGGANGNGSGKAGDGGAGSCTLEMIPG